MKEMTQTSRSRPIRPATTNATGRATRMERSMFVTTCWVT